MNKNNLVQNLQCLSTKQWRIFLEFVESPYFNKHQGVIQLAHYLHTCHPKWSEKNMNRHTVFLKCFPDQPYELQKLKDLFSKLQKQLRHFVAADCFQSQKEWQQRALIQGAFEMNMPALWQQQNKQFKQNKASFYHAFPLAELEKNDMLKKGDRKNTQKMIGHQIDWLEHFFWKERFRLAIERISLIKVVNAEIKDQNKAAFNHLPQVLKDDKTIHRYSITIQMLQLEFPQSEAFFLQLLESIKENDFEQCTSAESYAFYVYALNYCTARINSGNGAYYKYLFIIYELLDLHGRLIQNNTLSQWTFINIVATACNLKKFEWVAHFIHNYHSYIPINQRENALFYNSALVRFYQKDYNKALEHLHKVIFNDAYYSLNARVLEIRIFYYKKEWLVLDSLFERFRIYLLRNKDIPKQRKQESQYFLKLTKSLANLSQSIQIGNKNNPEITHLLNKIEDSKWLMHRAWLKKMGQKLLKPD